MKNDFTLTRIKRSTLDLIRKLAEEGHRSIPMQLDVMTDAFIAMQDDAENMVQTPTVQVQP